MFYTTYQVLLKMLFNHLTVIFSKQKYCAQEYTYDYTKEYIPEVFWNKRIAKVNIVQLTIFDNYVIAFVKLEEWCDTETAYHLIENLKTKKEARFYYYTNEFVIGNATTLIHDFQNENIYNIIETTNLIELLL